MLEVNSAVKAEQMERPFAQSGASVGVMKDQCIKTVLIKLSDAADQ